MPPRKRSKGSRKNKARKSAGKRNGPGDPDPVITIYPDGTYDPLGGVSIPPGGKVRFDLDNFPKDKNTCLIAIDISFEEEPFHAPVGTIKVGS